MSERRIPEWLRHAPAPGIRGFAVLTGIEAVARGMLISVFPLAMYRALGDAALVSQAYFVVGLLSLAGGLTVPWLTRFLPRRWTYTLGGAFFVAGAALAMRGGVEATIAGLFLNGVGTVTLFICLHAYILDYVAKVELGRCETLRMFYSALAWATGPVAGVWLFQLWEPAPFLVSIGAIICLQAVFWAMRLGNGKLITRARAPAPNPIAYLPRFLAQPRLVAGLLFAVLRSFGWWVYIVYLPIYAVENGLGEDVGGMALSLSNACLFLAPLMLRWIQRRSVRQAVRTGFLCAAMLFSAAALAPLGPWSLVGLAFLGSVFLVLLDICAGLPFLMAVRPAERTEMSAVYASYRDISGLLAPGAAALVLLAAPVSAIFLAAGTGLFAAWAVAASLHPRLGLRRAVAGEAAREMAPAAEAARMPAVN